MVFLDKHSQELFWLQRRIRFIQELDELLQRDASPEEAVLMAAEFKKVENPTDVVDRMREIYGKAIIK